MRLHDTRRKKRSIYQDPINALSGELPRMEGRDYSKTLAMNRADLQHQTWLAKHVSDPPVTMGFEGKTEAQKKRAREVLDEFLKDHPPGKEALVANAVLGETEHSHLFIKEIIKPDTGGVRMKFYGVDYFLRGNPTQAQVFGLELAKSNLFQLPRKLFKNPLFLIAAGLTYLFARKKFYKLLYWELREIHWKVTRHADPPPKEYNEFGRELKRVIHEALLKVFNIDNQRPYYPSSDEARFNKFKAYPDAGDVKSNHFGWCVAMFARFTITFLELDSAYRFRLQDALGLKPKNIEELLQVLLSRETKFKDGYNRSSGSANVLKWRMIRGIMKVLFFFEPQGKKFVNEVLATIDTEKVKMDENDWYFCLGWTSYDFGGKTYEERIQIREGLDIKNNHAFWTLWNRVK